MAYALTYPVADKWEPRIWLIASRALFKPSFYPNHPRGVQACFTLADMVVQETELSYCLRPGHQEA